jgi:tetratricopeptide (TPR) repeat protein
MLELPLWNLHFLLPLGLLVGISVNDGNGRKLPTLRPFVLVLIVLMSVLIWHTAKSYRDLASLWLERQSYSQVLQRYMQAARNPLLAPLAESSIADMQLLTQDKIEAKIALYRKVIRYRPYPRAVIRQAILLGLAGHQEEGLAMMRQILRLYPEYWKYFKRSFCHHPFISDDARRMLQDWTQSNMIPAELPACS